MSPLPERARIVAQFIESQAVRVIDRDPALALALAVASKDLQTALEDDQRTPSDLPTVGPIDDTGRANTLNRYPTTSRR